VLTVATSAGTPRRRAASPVPSQRALNVAARRRVERRVGSCGDRQQRPRRPGEVAVGCRLGKHAGVAERRARRGIGLAVSGEPDCAQKPSVLFKEFYGKASDIGPLLVYRGLK